jgi:hydrogenase-4 component F
MAPILVVLPLVFALLCLLVPAPRLRLALLVLGAWAHVGAVAWMWLGPPVRWVHFSFIGLDGLGQLFVTLISVLFGATSVYFVGYQRRTLISQRVFLACMLALLGALSLVCVSQHLGILWVALEASTLAAAPLIYFHLGSRALAATWKFLLMNSVGIALALLGIFCLAIAAGGRGEALWVNRALLHSFGVDPTWLRAGFLLALVGFGTKMGLAPMHAWLPDAHGEAPAPVSALLSGAVLNAALLGLLRVYHVCAQSGQAAFAGQWLVAFGLVSVGVAAVFMYGEGDFKRLLALSSVENMGIIAVGVGLGAVGAYPSMLHVLHNTLNKGIVFFLAGFLGHMFATTRIADIRGVLARAPLAGVLLAAGLCAICALPPFGTFFSELGIIVGAAQAGRWMVLVLFTVLLAIAFVNLVSAVLPMIFGQPPEAADTAPVAGPLARWRRTTMLTVAAVLVLLALGLGAYQPAAVRDALVQAAETVCQPGVDALTLATGAEVQP